MLRFDKRGTGMSDRLTELPSLDTRMDDIRAVMDAASERAVLFVVGDGGLARSSRPPIPSARGDSLFNSAARYTRTPDMPWRGREPSSRHSRRGPAREWGDVDVMAESMKPVIPSATAEELRQQARLSRLSHSPGAAAAYLLPNLDLDVRDVLPAIRVPTLVMYRAGAGYSSPQKNGRYLAEHIPTARLVELPGADLAPAWGDERLFSELEQFLQETAEGGAPEVDADRVLATVLFSDLVDATAHASKRDARRDYKRTTS